MCNCKDIIQRVLHSINGSSTMTCHVKPYYQITVRIFLKTKTMSSRPRLPCCSFIAIETLLSALELGSDGAFLLSQHLRDRGSQILNNKNNKIDPYFKTISNWPFLFNMTPSRVMEVYVAICCLFFYIVKEYAILCMHHILLNDSPKMSVYF